MLMMVSGKPCENTLKNYKEVFRQNAVKLFGAKGENGCEQAYCLNQVVVLFKNFQSFNCGFNIVTTLAHNEKPQHWPIGLISQPTKLTHTQYLIY